MNKTFAFPFFFVLLCLFSFASAGNYSTINVDRPYNLRSLDYMPLLNRYHDITVGTAQQTFSYPAIDSTFRQRKDSSSMLSWFSESGRAELFISPVLAWDIRGGKHLGDTITGYEGGLFMSGYIDSLEFWMDTRIFSEGHSAKYPKSWDREFLENQGDKDIDGEVKYSSYARYRGHIAMRMGWAVLDFGRDAAHWGPGYYNNLTLNQGSVPFNQVTLSTKIGPLSVISLYGDLDAGSHSMGKSKSRNLYGHRYEFEFGNLTFGLSEISIVYDLNPYWLFVPIVPLFAEKGNYSEDNNNGAISFDFSYRFPVGLRFYSEFFLDDMESPTSLFRNDNIEAKWAWMAGAEYAGNFGEWKIGSIAEYSRMEPYVLSHFQKNTAQIAHLGYPIGLQAGPNSQTIDHLIYAKHLQHFLVQLKQEWLWKGTDYGSAINDTTPRYDPNTGKNHYNTKKYFLRDKDGNLVKMQYSLTPAISYMSTHYAISTEYTFFNRNAFCSRIMFLW